jgi:hypothetical protein
VEHVSQLFDTLDPFPFPERDLDREAEEYIVGWARELPRSEAIRVDVHIPRDQIGSRDAVILPDALRRFFTYRAELVARDLKELFRLGRTSLAIGLTVLAVCLAANQLVAGWIGDTPFERFLAESLIIVGWVANWKPLEIFLYDWWPLIRRRNLYRRLAAAKVSVIAVDQFQAAPL